MELTGVGSSGLRLWGETRNYADPNREGHGHGDCTDYLSSILSLNLANSLFELHLLLLHGVQFENERFKSSARVRDRQVGTHGLGSQISDPGASKETNVTLL